MTTQQGRIDVKPDTERNRGSAFFPRRWWHRVGVQVLVDWSLNGTRDTSSWQSLRRWALNGGITRRNRRSGRPVVWRGAWAQILGLSIGAGFYVDVGERVEL